MVRLWGQLSHKRFFYFFGNLGRKDNIGSKEKFAKIEFCSKKLVLFFKCIYIFI